MCRFTAVSHSCFLWLRNCSKCWNLISQEMFHTDFRLNYIAIFSLLPPSNFHFYTCSFIHSRAAVCAECTNPFLINGPTYGWTGSFHFRITCISWVCFCSIFIDLQVNPACGSLFKCTTHKPYVEELEANIIPHLRTGCGIIPSWNNNIKPMLIKDFSGGLWVGKM